MIVRTVAPMTLCCMLAGCGSSGPAVERSTIPLAVPHAGGHHTPAYLYVANTTNASGAHKPSHTYAGAVCAFDAVADSAGTVYVADACGEDDRGRVLEFARGSKTPTGYLYPGGSPYAVTVDSHDNLYVGYNGNFTAFWQTSLSITMARSSSRANSMALSTCSRARESRRRE